jgi:hypothetical protein
MLSETIKPRWVKILVAAFPNGSLCSIVPWRYELLRAVQVRVDCLRHNRRLVPKVDGVQRNIKY